MKTIIERGASWTLEETKMLLALWGQDLVQRKATNLKRTKEVYEKISEKFNQSGYERTADQVRTRVFNMIAEYRRILKDPTQERVKKCIFFEALHKIYEAQHMDDVKSALDDYEPEYPYSPVSNTISSEKGDESISDSEATEGNESINHSTTNNTTITSKDNASNNINNNNSTNTNSNTINNSSSNAANNQANDTSINDNDGDSNNNNNSSNSNNSSSKRRESSPSLIQNTCATSSKKPKIEPRTGHNQTNNQASNIASASINPSEQTNSKQTKSSSASSSSTSSSTTTTAVASTSATSSSLAASHSTSSSSSSTTSAAQRHQSLLLPHATTSTTSTPIGKLTTSGGSNNTPSYINITPSTKLPIIRTNQLIGHSNGSDSISLNGTTTRLPTTATITGHQPVMAYQAPVSTFDVTSSALLIDRMFAHLSRESENMREWIALEKERLSLERTRRQQETEREVRRERVLIDTLMRFQEQWLSFLTRIDPRIVENLPEQPPELKIPSKESSQATNTNSAPPTLSTSTTTATNDVSQSAQSAQNTE